MQALPLLLGLQMTLEAFLNDFKSLDWICQIRWWLYYIHKLTRLRELMQMKCSEQFLAKSNRSINVCSSSQSPDWSALVSHPTLWLCGWGVRPCILQPLESTGLFGFESQFCRVIYRLCGYEQVPYCPEPPFPHSSNKADNITIITTSSNAARIPLVQQLFSDALLCLRPHAGY